MNNNLILASGSKIRANLLKNAGFTFNIVKSNIDERTIKELANNSDMAQLLAFEKADEVSKRYKDKLIIGCDQILEFENNILHKVNSIAEAKQRIINFNGKEHFLYSAVCLVKNNITFWQLVKKTKLKMANNSIQIIENYIKKAGDNILNSVACYEIENIGINLFEKIEGNYHDIMGLPLLELINSLKNYNIRGSD